MQYNLSMNARIIKFNSFSTHPWLSRLFNKLKKEDIDFAIKFLTNESSKSRSDFELAVNRIFLDRDKPRAWKEITELLISSNS